MTAIDRFHSYNMLHVLEGLMEQNTYMFGSHDKLYIVSTGLQEFIDSIWTQEVVRFHSIDAHDYVVMLNFSSKISCSTGDDLKSRIVTGSYGILQLGVHRVIHIE